MNLKKFLKDNCLTVNNSLNVKRISVSVLDEINSSAPNWANSLSEKCYCIIHNIDTQSICIGCRKEVTSFQSFTKGYREYCSLKCSNNSMRVKKKKKNTSMAIYGVDNPAKSDVVKEKSMNTCLEKYGVSNASQCEEIKKSISDSHHSRSIEEVEQSNKKRTDTVFYTYGVKHISQLSDIKKKKEDICLQEHGVTHIWKDPNKRKEIFNTVLGVDNPFQSKNVKEKIKKTLLDTLGVDNPSKHPQIIEKANQTKRKNYYENIDNRVNKQVIPQFEKNQYVGNKNLYDWQCNSCGNKFSDKLINGRIPICRVCFPFKAKTSYQEDEVANWIKNTFDIKVEKSNRSIISPKELDIFLPDLNIAIEYCGLYWHSDKKVNNMYHREKWKACQEKGVRLITLFADEWLLNKNICKTRIAYILGKSNKICNARDTVISEIKPQEHRDFLKQTHIQGAVNAKIKLGAFFRNNLVAVMSFGRHRVALGSKNKQGFELLRFSTIGNIPGIASKLFSYYIKNYKPIEIISYCDLRWGNGDLYKMLGFDCVSITKPNYWYVNLKKNSSREHRFAYRKDILVKEGFDPLLSEREIMENRGFVRIYDCGSKKYNWSR